MECNYTDPLSWTAFGAFLIGLAFASLAFLIVLRMSQPPIPTEQEIIDSEPIDVSDDTYQFPSHSLVPVIDHTTHPRGRVHVQQPF